MHEAEQLARVHVSRIIWVFGTSASRLVTVAIVGFLLAMLATFGFFYRYEIAMAAFTLLAPLVLVQGLGIRLAFVVEAKGLNGAALCSALFRHRFWTQVIALMAIAFSAGIASVSLSRDIAVWH